MAKIKASALIELFERMAREKWRYEWGAAKDGCVDCSGAFVYAFKALGGPYIEHGSNAIARKRVGELQPISEAKPGWACFKVRGWADSESGNRWYGSAPGDVHHIGLMGSDGQILNAQSVATGFVKSSTRNWAYCAPLDAIDYAGDGEGGEKEMWGNAEVHITSGHLNMRAGASTKSKVIAELENGQRISIERDEGNGWVLGQTQAGQSGYIAARYLEMDQHAPKQEEPQTPTQTAQSRTTIRRADGIMITLDGSWTIAED